MTESELRAFWLSWCRSGSLAVSPRVTAAGWLVTWGSAEGALAMLMRLRSRDTHFQAAREILETAMRRD